MTLADYSAAIEGAGVVSTIILTIVIICITTQISKKQNALQNKISKDATNVALYKYRVDIYLKILKIFDKINEFNLSNYEIFIKEICNVIRINEMELFFEQAKNDTYTIWLESEVLLDKNNCETLYIISNRCKIISELFILLKKSGAFGLATKAVESSLNFNDDFKKFTDNYNEIQILCNNNDFKNKLLKNIRI